MPTDLERDLGLYAVVTISVGAMIGSGIFVLPGLAFKIAGPAVILAYFLAGMIVLPAALSKAERRTAMPEAGGPCFLHVLDPDASDAQVDSAQSHRRELDGLCTVTTESEVIRGGTDALIEATERAAIVVIGGASHRRLTDVLFGTFQDMLIASVDRTVIPVHSAEPRSHTFLWAILEWFVYRRPSQRDRGNAEYSGS